MPESSLLRPGVSAITPPPPAHTWDVSAGGALPARPLRSPSRSVGHRGAGLQQRLEVTENPRPATPGADVLQLAGEHLRQPGLVPDLVRHGQRRHAVLALL